jgi:hypothetical protein
MRMKIVLAMPLGSTLCGCDRHDTSTNDMSSNAVRLASADTVLKSTADAAQQNNAQSTDETEPNFVPPTLTEDAESGVKGARNVLLSFAGAIEQKKYHQAWALLSSADKLKWSQNAFADIFAGLEKSTVAIPDGRTGGGAGSVYYTVPVIITGSDKDGRPVRFEGKANLSRVNKSDGATRSQMQWHFEKFALDWVH